MGQLTLLLVLLTATIALSPLAVRWNVPYPVLLLVFGLLIAFVPGLPRADISPDLILPLVLPPLLFAAARRTSWREFLDNRRAIGLLAVALVGVTALVVGVVLQALVPGLPLIAAIALGALVAPPDPVAATTVARGLRLPRRLQTVLEGEGLSNDATSLVLYEVAVAAVATGAFSPVKAGGQLLLAISLGITIGLLIALATRWLLNRLPAHPAGTALVLVVPFVAYVAADEAHGSGVLAVVTLALALSRYADKESAATRLAAGTTWEIVELLVTGAAFAFVGLELRVIAESVPGDVTVLIGQALAITAFVVVVRFVWIFLVGSLEEKFRRRRGRDAEPVGWQEMTVASWAGMRGVVTLAAALALPTEGFPERDRLIFIAFVVIIVTLLVQGLTLPLLVRRLGVQTSESHRIASEQKVMRRARDAGFDRLDELKGDDSVDKRLLEQAYQDATTMWHKLGLEPDEDEDREFPVRSIAHARHLARVEAELLAAARTEVVAARNEHGADPVIVDEVLHRLDATGAVAKTNSVSDETEHG
ncbi:Na+/H+ antiporter [Antrihabitans spumae]|uniref:Na+/H+ antiporter n=1 Tax=Antrihabitans spumae TaxID=3373370 RepID=A0ABW7JJ69_9NOCA